MADKHSVTMDKCMANIQTYIHRPENLELIERAWKFAEKAHEGQFRKSGEPYTIHVIQVANILAGLHCSPKTIAAGLLHDTLEDCDWVTYELLEKEFSKEIADLVEAVTKIGNINREFKDEKEYQASNHRKIFIAMAKDIRVILVKLSDRLHNMRTLSSMRTDKQMKIAGETDYFYAPLATRLGLYDVKTELENLSLKFRCPTEYAYLERRITEDEREHRPRLQAFIEEISAILSSNGIKARVFYEYRRPYSLWRKMLKYGDDFDHLRYRHFVDIVFKEEDDTSEKSEVLRIYSLLTDRFKEKPGGISNYIDSPKENGYQSFHLKLLADYGRWEEVHISSERMVRNSRFGCLSDRSEGNIRRWINKFRGVLKDIAQHGQDGSNFIENVVASFYNDDIMTFSPKGKPVILPQKATPIDFAYEIHSELGLHAKYCRINGRIASIKQPLHRGDIVEILTSPDSHPEEDWLDHAVSYKARRSITSYLAHRKKPEFERCSHCHPIPGEEVIGFKNSKGEITVHKRDCSVAIKLASQDGDSIVAVDYRPDSTIYPEEIEIICIDRRHMVIDIMDCISNRLNLNVYSLNTSTTDSIVTMKLCLGVHGFDELQTITSAISAIPDVEEVKSVTLN